MSLSLAGKGSSMKTKLYTLEEANLALTQIEALLDTLVDIKLQINKHQAEIDVLELIQEGSGIRRVKPGSAYFEKKLEEMQTLFDQFKHNIHQFAELGCELKDLDRGLIDFYSLKEDKLVYLCWKKGEKKITHWHEIETGFAGRKKI